MKRLGAEPMSLALSADDVVEFHAARLLLLLRLCGTSNRIDGLTKMAKLDFFVRYPEFFAIAKAAAFTESETATAPVEQDSIESAMVRYHYGPWDKRYYQVLAHLEAKGLIKVAKEKKAYRLLLTSEGQTCADLIARKDSFMPIVDRMREVKKVFGGKSGDYLKRLIYRLFDAEVGKRKMGGVIKK